MLKFVHGVQAKSSIPLDNICSTMRINAIDFDFNDSDDPDEALWCFIEIMQITYYNTHYPWCLFRSKC